MGGARAGRIGDEGVAPYDCYVAVDLTFSDQTLEKLFENKHHDSQRWHDAVLSLGVRGLGWMGTALKLWWRGHAQLGAIAVMLAAGLSTSLLPVLGMLGGRDSYRRHRTWLVLLSNALQFYVVVIYYDSLYSCGNACSDDSDVGWQRALAAVASANGAAFLAMSATMGSLLFRWLFPAQALYLTILLLNNRTICARSPALRTAYSLASAFVTSPGAAVAAGALHVTNSSLPATPLLPLLPATAALGTGSVCATYQMLVQLLLGFWLPCCLAYARELRARYAFLRERCVPHLPELRSSCDIFIYSMPALGLSAALLGQLGRL